MFWTISKTVLDNMFCLKCFKSVSSLSEICSVNHAVWRNTREIWFRFTTKTFLFLWSSARANMNFSQELTSFSKGHRFGQMENVKGTKTLLNPKKNTNRLPEQNNVQLMLHCVCITHFSEFEPNRFLKPFLKLFFVLFLMWKIGNRNFVYISKKSIF